jgi:hypothetical protein
VGELKLGKFERELGMNLRENKIRIKVSKKT